ncbi:sigma-54 dependent transcriptional regulator [Ruegeria sp. SCPT10]|uniref:sigma-54-dependent transcriptional regulator n=1 Tax=Ruegeria sp. SCP10 TaxID=3141377 RepID=UPI003338F0E9
MNKITRVTIVDDEPEIRNSLKQWLTLSGYQPDVYECAEEALKNIQPNYPGVVISDLKLPGMDGSQFLTNLLRIDKDIPIIMITGHGDIQSAVDCIRLGAFDFLEKPFKPEALVEQVECCLAQRRITLSSRAPAILKTGDGLQLLRGFMGSSEKIAQARHQLVDASRSNGHVLINGETGTGKTLAAHTLHALGGGNGSCFKAISCSATSDVGLNRELFGDSSGNDRTVGALEDCRGGTLILEDVEYLSDDQQSRLLARMDEQNSETRTRIVAVSSLQELDGSCQGRLRPSLFFRLTSSQIEMPSLRDRNEDIMPLFSHYIRAFSEEYGREIPVVNSSEKKLLLEAPWPGNIRQLKNFAERVTLKNRRGIDIISSLLIADNEIHLSAMTTEGKPLKEYVEAFERMLIDTTIKRHKGVISSVLDELCLPRRTLNEKMAKYGLQRSNYL